MNKFDVDKMLEDIGYKKLSPPESATVAHTVVMVNAEPVQRVDWLTVRIINKEKVIQTEEQQ